VFRRFQANLGLVLELCKTYIAGDEDIWRGTTEKTRARMQAVMPMKNEGRN
jgi:hypothetical protein